MEKFSSLIAEKRKEQGLTFLALSKKAGVVPSAFFSYENGTSFPKHRTLKKICEMFSLNYDEMAELIEMEKESKVYEKALFPDMRKIFLDSYNDGYGSKTDINLSEKEIKDRLSTKPLHIIEEVLLRVTNKRLHDQGFLPAEEKIEKLDKPIPDKQDLFLEVITEWGYIPSAKSVLIGAKNEAGIITIKPEKVPEEE